MGEQRAKRRARIEGKGGKEERKNCCVNFYFKSVS
jgi:hypothetical protein